MKFGEAVECMKDGLRVARNGWNGQGMFAYYVPGAVYKAMTDAAKEIFGEEVPYRPYFALKTVQNDVAVWNPSTSDILAEDWVIVR